MRAVLLLGACLELAAAAAPEKKIVCIFYSGKMNIEYVDPTLCTHVIYESAKVIADGDVEVMFPPNDIPSNWGRDGYGGINRLRQKNPSLKTFISFNGVINELSKSRLGYNSTCWEKIIDNIVKFTKRWDFNGMDVYPNEEDLLELFYQPNIVKLFKFLRMRCNREGLIFSWTVYGPEEIARVLYNIGEISNYADFINMAVYGDCHDCYNYTWHNAPLQAGFNDDTSVKALSLEAAAMYWLSKGAPRDKLIVAIKGYGTPFTLSNPNENTVGAPISGAGATGPRTNDTEQIAYNEICELQRTGRWNIVFDEEHRVPYTFKGNQWIGYENVKSVREKAEFIARLNLGGASFFAIAGDDYRGICGEKYPLLKTINAVLRNGEPVPEESLPAPPRCTKAGHMRDPNSCGVILCAPNTTGDYDEYFFECRPGNCHNPMIGKVRGESVDPNFFICGD